MENKYSLTFPQKNIWLVETFYDNKRMNIISGSLKINKDFDPLLAEKVINKFVELNEAMRFTVKVTDGKPENILNEYSYFEIDKVVENDEDKIKKIKEDSIEKSIDIFSNKLYSYLIIDKGNGKGEIFLKVHHIICDAWSVSKMGEELSSIYEKFLNGDGNIEKYPSYIEFMQKEDEYIQGEKKDKDKEFWKEYLKEYTEPVGLKEFSDNISYAAKRYATKLNKELENKLNDFCAENKCSPYTVFMVALAIYMERVTEKTDLIIGTPVLNRSNFAEKNMQGMFVSTMPVRFKIDEQETFLDLCKKQALESMSLFRHQKYPYSMIAEDVKENNGLKEKIYRVMLSYQNARTVFEDKDKYEITWDFSGAIQDELEIHISDLNNDGSLNIFYDYLVDVFDPIEIEYLAKRIEEIIRDGIENNKTVETINIMPEEEKNKILYEFNDTARDYPKDKTVIDLFEEQVEKTPNNIALVFEDKEMTYKELNDKANSLAWYLKEQGIKEHDFVGIIIDKSIELIISITGILKLGCCYVPIEINYSSDRKKYLLKDSGCKLVIVDDNEKNNLETQTININQITINKYETKNSITRSEKYKSDSPNCVLYTSGTTGEPKGAIIINRNIVKLVKNADYISFKEEDGILQAASTSFDVSLFEIWGSLLNGGKLYIIKKFNLINPRYLTEYLRKNNITILWITSALFNQMIEANANMFCKLRRIFTGGDIISIKHVNQLKDACPNLLITNCYGPTECTTFTNTFNIEKKQSKRIPIGKAISNTIGYVVDSKLRLLPLYTYGEYVIAGESVALGYVNKPGLTEEKFIKNIFNDVFECDRMYKSGDIVQMFEGGYIDFIGRRDNQVKIRGFRIELDEIKLVINNIKNIKDSVVIIRENGDKKEIYAYFTSDEDQNIIKIIEYLKNKLPVYMVPNKIMQLKQLPINQNGKLDRSMLPKPVENIYVEDKTPKNEIQNKISEIINNVIGENFNFDIKTNILDSGVDSLSAIKICIEISDHYKVDIQPRDILSGMSIEDIEILIKNSKKNNSKKSLINKDSTLSSNQKGIFTSYVMNTESLNYNIPFEIKFDKKLDCFKLKDSIEKVINSIPNIFGHIEIENSNIVQKINSVDFKLEIEKISNEEYEMIRNNFVKPFDLLKGPLFDIKMYSTETNIFILLDFHHIIFDGASISMLMDRIKKHYETGELKENIVAQRTMFLEDDPKYIEAKKYFLDEFSGELPINDLPLDYKRPNEKSSAGDNIIINIDEKLTENINKYSKANNVTINSIFLSALNILLSKYMYSEDIIVGVTTLGRNTQEELNTIGMFVKTIPFRTDIDYEKNTLAFISEIQNHLMMSIENDIYSYDDLVKELKLQRDPSRNPLFDILYTYQGFQMNELNIDNNTGEIFRLPTNTAKFDINIEVINNYNTIDINTEYCSAIISKSMANDFTKHYINIIKNIIEKQSSLKLKDIDMILDNEKDDVLNIYNNTKTNYPMKETATRIFEKNVLKNPDKIAVVFEDEKLTYKELNEKANQVAHLIIQKNINEGSTIAIMIDKSIEFMIGALGVLKANCVYMPMDKSMPDERIKFVLEDSATKLIITTKEYYKGVSDLDTIFIDIDNKEVFDQKNKENLNLSQTSDKPAYIIYTSGSTGKPKGNIIIHKGIVRLVLNTNYLFFSEKDVMMVSGSLTFDTTIFEIWGAMLFGMTLHFIAKDKVVNPIQFKQYILNNNITTGLIPTPIFNQLVEYDSEMFKNMHQICVGGDTFMAKYSNQVFEKCKKLILTNVYGPAENAVICTANIIEKKYDGNIPIGKVTSNSTCYVVDKCDNLCPPRVPGELYVGGDGLGLGYLNREELTKEKFTIPKCLNEKIYKTGDLTSWNTDGTINFKGRIDFQIKIRGQRIEITEIQNKMLEIKEVKEVVILALDNNLGNKYLVAYYTLNRPYEEKNIEEYLRKYLPTYMIPTRFVLMKEMPLNQNGKIDRKALPIVDENIKIEKVDPQNEEQEKLLNLYRRVLNNNNFFMTDNFFENGGDSLIAMNLAAEAANEDLPMLYAKIFDYPTPLEMYREMYINNDNDYEGLQKEIDDYNYNEVNEILNEKTKIVIPNKKRNILLTGAPGFLGSHILDNLLSKTDLDIYCLVRRKNNLDPKERLKERLHFFFGKKYDKEFDKRVKVIEGDLTIENLFTNKENLEEVVKNVGIVINTAAYVKHYGKKEIFESININGVNNLAKFSDENGMKFVHISTLSVSGNMLEAGQIEQTRINVPTSYTEKDLYIGQELNNIYAYSKFIAERNILEKMVSSNLNAIILRVGNLTGRYSDGTFQPNVEENAFVGRIKSFINLGSVAKKMVDMDMEFTPIDLVADAIVRLATHTNKQVVYHVYNSNHAKLYKLIDSLEKFRIKIKILEDNEQKNRINKLLKNKQAEKINGILIDINSEKDVAYFSNIHIDSKETIIALKKLGFSWPIIEQDYIDKYFKYLRKIKFI